MSRSTTRKPIRKNKNVLNVNFFVGNRKTCDFGKCNKGLDTTCYRQSRNKCLEWEFTIKC